MTAVSIALTAAEAAAIERAHVALNWIGADTFPWPSHGSRDIKECAESLREALDDYAGLGTGRHHPADLFPDLGRGQDNAMELALDWVTADIREWTRDLEALARVAEKTAREQEVGGLG